jgi:hypothetical protein
MCEFSSLSCVESPFYCHVDGCDFTGYRWIYFSRVEQKCFKTSFEWCQFYFCMLFSFCWITSWSHSYYFEHPVFLDEMRIFSLGITFLALFPVWNSVLNCIWGWRLMYGMRYDSGNILFRNPLRKFMFRGEWMQSRTCT